MSKNESVILNFDHPKQRATAISYIKGLRGPHRFDVRPVRKTRTLNQNAWYWGCVLPAVCSGLLEAWGEQLSAEEAHDWLKGRFNSKLIVDRKTGEVKGRRPCSTADLDTAEFSAYLEKVIRFCGEELGVEVPEASGSYAA